MIWNSFQRILLVKHGFQIKSGNSIFRTSATQAMQYITYLNSCCNIFIRNYVFVSLVLVIVGCLLFIILNTGISTSSAKRIEWLSSSRILRVRAVLNNERLLLWQYTLSIISARPWLGFGPETFSLAYLRTYPENTASALQEVNPWDRIIGVYTT
jgi:hypothetical protein